MQYKIGRKSKYHSSISLLQLGICFHWSTEYRRPFITGDRRTEILLAYCSYAHTHCITNREKKTEYACDMKVIDSGVWDLNLKWKQVLTILGAERERKRRPTATRQTIVLKILSWTRKTLAQVTVDCLIRNSIYKSCVRCCDSLEIWISFTPSTFFYDF